MPRLRPYGRAQWENSPVGKGGLLAKSQVRKGDLPPLLRNTQFPW